MGLLTILKKIKRKEKEVRILILGLDNAGKTTIVKQLNGEDLSTISPTVGFDIHTFEYEPFKLNLWDIGGQKSIRMYWKNYFEETDGLVWVVDSSDEDRLQLCAEELHKLLQEERLAGASLLVLANKQDIAGAMTVERIHEVLRIKDIKSHHCQIVKCSARTGEGVMGGLDWLVSDISSRLFVSE